MVVWILGEVTAPENLFASGQRRCRSMLTQMCCRAALMQTAILSAAQTGGISSIACEMSSCFHGWTVLGLSRAQVTGHLRQTGQESNSLMHLQCRSYASVWPPADMDQFHLWVQLCPVPAAGAIRWLSSPLSLMFLFTAYQVLQGNVVPSSQPRQAALPRRQQPYMNG